MDRRLPEILPLCCPACRTRDEAGWRVFTVALTATLQVAPGAVGEAGEVLQGLLTCQNPACARVYPIVDGIPLLVSDLAGLLRAELPTLGALDALDLALLQELALCGTDQDALPALLEHLSVYLDAHYGDRAEPPPDGVGAALGMGALCERLAARATHQVARAVELGCSVGRGVATLAGGAALTVGVDLRLAALRQARRALAGERLSYLRRVVGRHYLRAELSLPAVSGVALVCGDALDPPLCPGGFDRVVALNLLDSVAAPPQLLSVMDALCRPGGELLVSSPYAWQSSVVVEGQRLGGADPAGALGAQLRGGAGLEAPYEVEEEAELAWRLRRDARLCHHYRVHYLRARKRAGLEVGAGQG